MDQPSGTRSVTESIVMGFVSDGTDDNTGEVDALLVGVDILDGAGALDRDEAPISDAAEGVVVPHPARSNAAVPANGAIYRCFM